MKKLPDLFRVSTVLEHGHGHHSGLCFAAMSGELLRELNWIPHVPVLPVMWVARECPSSDGLLSTFISTCRFTVIHFVQILTKQSISLTDAMP